MLIVEISPNNHMINSDGFRKRGAWWKKSKGGHYLVCQKKVAETVLVYESKVVTKKKRSPLSQFFPKIMVFSKKKRSSLTIHLPFPNNFFPKIMVFPSQQCYAGPMQALRGLPVGEPYRFGRGRCSGPT